MESLKDLLQGLGGDLVCYMYTSLTNKKSMQNLTHVRVALLTEERITGNICCMRHELTFLFSLTNSQITQMNMTPPGLVIIS